jgi:hypothetical protein
MDITKANECLRYWYGPSRKGTFDNIDVGVIEGEPTQMVSLKEAVKVAAEVVANAVAEAPPGEPDDDESESHDEGAYAAFKEAIEVEDHEASYIEAL